MIAYQFKKGCKYKIQGYKLVSRRLLKHVTRHSSLFRTPCVRLKHKDIFIKNVLIIPEIIHQSY